MEKIRVYHKLIVNAESPDTKSVYNSFCRYPFSKYRQVAFSPVSLEGRSAYLRVASVLVGQYTTLAQDMLIHYNKDKFFLQLTYIIDPTYLQSSLCAHPHLYRVLLPPTSYLENRPPTHLYHTLSLSLLLSLSFISVYVISIQANFMYSRRMYRVFMPDKIRHSTRQVLSLKSSPRSIS